MAISDSVALPASDATSSSSSDTVSIDVVALSVTVSAVVTEALKTTLSSETLTGILKTTGPPIPLEPLALESSSSVGDALTAEVADILQDGHASGTNRGGVPTTLNDFRPPSTFTSISVPLSARAGAHQMEPPSPKQALGANPFPSRFIIRTGPRGDFARWRWEEPITTTKWHCYCTSSNNRKFGVDRPNTIIS